MFTTCTARADRDQGKQRTKKAAEEGKEKEGLAEKEAEREREREREQGRAKRWEGRSAGQAKSEASGKKTPRSRPSSSSSPSVSRSDLCVQSHDHIEIDTSKLRAKTSLAKLASLKPGVLSVSRYNPSTLQDLGRHGSGPEGVEPA